MNQSQAREILSKVERVCRENKLFFSVEFENKPELKMIRIKEISIKIDDKE